MSNNSGAAVSRTGRRVTLTPVGIAGAGHDDLLAYEPANLTGALIGYARVSTSGQILDRQTRALTEVGCIRLAWTISRRGHALSAAIVVL